MLGSAQRPKAFAEMRLQTQWFGNAKVMFLVLLKFTAHWAGSPWSGHPGLRLGYGAQGALLRADGWCRACFQHGSNQGMLSNISPRDKQGCEEDSGPQFK